MSHGERRYNVWIVARPAPDLPGQWIAHCLDIDVVSQGDSLNHAIRMAHEAVSMVVVDELNKGRDPQARRAPQEFFDELYGLFERNEELSGEALAEAEAEGRLVLFATQVELRIDPCDVGEDEPAPRSMRPTPMRAALTNASQAA